MCHIVVCLITTSELERGQTVYFSTSGTFQTSSGKSHHPCFLLLTSEQLLVFHVKQEQLLHCFSVDKYSTSIAPGDSTNTASLIITATEHQDSPVPGTKFHQPEQEEGSLQQHETAMPPIKPAAVLLLPVHHAHNLCHMFLIATQRKLHPNLRFTIQ